MHKIRERKGLVRLIIAVGAIVWTAHAYAQATRTWVSGVGDDVNPCSRTAPCKTFAGAIAKTAAGGEINCLDPGGFGAVTILKAMTINCLYTEGGMLAGGNGVVVNAGPTDVVYLRGLDIFGVNPPTNGVRFVAGAALHIEDSIIRRFNAANSQGVSFAPSGASRLYITNTTIADNGSGATGGGILVQPTGAGGSALVTLRNVRVQNNAFRQLRVDTTGNTGTGVNVVIEDSLFSGGNQAIQILSPAGAAPVAVMIDNATITLAGTGLRAEGSANAVVRVADSSITQNATGVATANGATILTYGNNRLDGNAPDGAFSGPVAPE